MEGETRTFVVNRREATFIGEVAGEPVRIAERGSVFVTSAADGAARLCPEPLPEPTGAALDLSGDWSVEFEPNQVPLSLWHVTAAEGELGSFTERPAVNLMQRSEDPAGEGDESVRYVCRFMLTGEIPDARVVIDDGTIGGDWTMKVNGHTVAGWERALIFDCRDQQAAIGEFLRGGSNPTLNIITIETSGRGRGLNPMPYLLGSCTCRFRYGDLSRPLLTGAPGPIALPNLQTWDALGWPTFSGSAVYRRTFSVDEPGDWLLELGRVEDIAAVTVDGQQVAVLPWPPYGCVLAQLSAGEHELAIEVTNPPANRTEAAHLPAGLLGPVRLAPVG